MLVQVVSGVPVHLSGILRGGFHIYVNRVNRDLMSDGRRLRLG